MDKKQEAFLRELLADFMIEAAEHQQAIISGLLELEKSLNEKDQQKVVETTFREMHSLKGAARAVNIVEVERLCQGLESVLSLLKQRNISISKYFFDTMHGAMDLLNQYIIDIAEKKKTVSNDQLVNTLKDVQSLCVGTAPVVKKTTLQAMSFDDEPEDLSVKKTSSSASLAVLANTQSLNPVEDEIESDDFSPPTGQTIPMVSNVTEPVDIASPYYTKKEAKVVHQEVTGLKDTVRIPVSKLSGLLNQAEELITAKNMFGHDLKELKRVGLQYHKTKDKSVNSVEGSSLMREDISILAKNMDQHYRIMARTVDDLLFSIKNTLLLPFSTILDLFPKLVRDLAKDTKKEIIFTVIGAEMEIDRRILEKIKDPIIHLLRNCIDHGIELPEERLKKNKSRSGDINLVIEKFNDGEITLTISDDGVGIEKEKVIESSIKLGIISPEKAEKLTDMEISNLIFNSGLSTSPFITDLSGHGLGLAIVSECVTQIGGSINVDFEKDKGTKFIITLPVTLQTFRGILVKIGENQFIITINAIEKAIRVKASDIKTIENRDTVLYNGENIGLVWLDQVLNFSTKKQRIDRDNYLPALVLVSGQQRIAFIVDSILDEHEGIIKDLGSQLINVRNVSGATLLGNGRVVPVLNAIQLIEEANSFLPQGYLISNIESEEATVEKQRVLVADDSITSRSLLRNIVESAGFIVKTAVDGFEAYKLLQEETFDLVVSDIEMPRLNGFELTVKIRNDKKISDLPIVLVTALEQPSDRQRGMESGANAYIVKSSFEQSNLIDAINRLI
ncbi:MAG: response regulator [Bacteroidetes bacterium]|nr:response regulator [Bacteroidota bacterium]